MISVHYFTFSPFQENTYVLHDETGACVIIDPGCYDKREEKELTDYIEKNNLSPKRLLNTHCHIDHVFGNDFVARTYNIGLEMHELDLPLLQGVTQQAQLYGLNVTPSPEPTHFLKAGDVVTFGNSSLRVIFVPGHAPGHIAFVSDEQRFVINGDVLFNGSIGRTDLPGGNFETLIHSIRTELFSLDDDFQVFTGHGTPTSIGYEKQHNPFLT
jgi:glyoxylase-like metal-dependent hydrolase (beta-lactamase superfamily II)